MQMKSREPENMYLHTNSDTKLPKKSKHHKATNTHLRKSREQSSDSKANQASV